MAWFNKKSKKDLEKQVEELLEEKLNPAQRLIGLREGNDVQSRENVFNYTTQYEKLEVVNRGVNMLVDDSSAIPSTVGDKISGITPIATIRKKSLERLLNFEPNPFQDISTFKRNLVVDLVLDGNIFMYWDGAHLYHLPANKMVIHPDPKTYISHYTYDGQIEYEPYEIIHIKENSFKSIYRGIPRLKPATSTMKLLTSMKGFQKNFFDNGAVPGLVLKSPNTLSEKIKAKMIDSWTTNYKPSSGGRRPLILDGGLEVDDLSKINFKELDFQSACNECEKIILRSLGIPVLLLDGGNNANITPNHRLYYLETVLPIVKKINFAVSRFFGYEVTEDITKVPALQPELRDQANYLSTLANAGIMSRNECRAKIGLEPKEGHDDLVIPANVAGSAADANTGGRPAEGEEDD